MENARFLECLETDYRRIREVAPAHLEAQVPTCPDWTMTDLVRHVGQVYLHKVECMRLGAEKESDWPPAGLVDEEPLALLDRSYADLVQELTTRDPADRGGTWYALDPTVGFWFRRMAQESVIHRVDAEYAAGAAVFPIPGDLAIDGVDELLRVFVAYSVAAWSDYFEETLAGSPGRTIKFVAAAAGDVPGVTWLVKTSAGQLTVEGGPGGPGETVAAGAPADVTVSGTPGDLLLWTWNREPSGEPSRVTIAGDRDALAEYQRCVVIATQ
jgi:uncharacterized protein (TIGR03083 family)